MPWHAHAIEPRARHGYRPAIRVPHVTYVMIMISSTDRGIHPASCNFGDHSNTNSFES